MEMPPTPTKKPARPLLWLLLLLPYLGLCFPQIYASNMPVLCGFPFFYWYQFAWVMLTSLILGLYYRLTRGSSTQNVMITSQTSAPQSH